MKDIFIKMIKILVLNKVFQATLNKKFKAKNLFRI